MTGKSLFEILLEQSKCLFLSDKSRINDYFWGLFKRVISMKKRISELYTKYRLTPEKILIGISLLAIILVRFLIQNKVEFKPLELVFDAYAKLLLALTELIISPWTSNYGFDYALNQLSGPTQILEIDLFYFSVNQIFAAFVVVLLTRSPYRIKLLYFMAAFLVFTLYNSLRIVAHALVPGTDHVHHWFFNILLIPRWILLILFTWLYWKKFPHLMELIKNKFNFSESFIRKSFVRMGLLVLFYYLLIIIVFNDYIWINGALLVAFVLNTSQYVLEILGYQSLINQKLIYGQGASLYMDDACLGINLMFLFAAFIGMMPGLTKHKLWFIPLGILIIIGLNILRVVLIFVHVSDNKTYDLPLGTHDLFTYPVLLFTFLMWVVWINKFSTSKKSS